MEKQPFSSITVKMDNGENLSAPVGIWLTALLASLKGSSDPILRELERSIVTTVEQMATEARSRQIIQPKHHVLHAEPLHLGIKVNGGNNGKLQ